MIRTVCRMLTPQELGHCQCHEHIWLRKGASFQSNEALCMDDEYRSLAELKEYAAAGGSLIVDAQPTGCGRDGRMLAQLSEKSGVDIVASAGFHKQMFFDQTELLSWDSKKLADLYVSEIEEGMTDTDGTVLPYRAGILKVAMENNWNTDPVYIRLFEAVAEAADRTGAPVMVHTEKGNDIAGLIRWFEQRKIAPSRLLICHLDRTHYDAAYHKEILASGCMFCYDSVHRLKYVSEQEELELLAEMREAGLLSQIVISLDTTNQRLRAYHAADMGLDYILKDYIPKMKAIGFTEWDIHRMCVENPGKILDF